MTLDAPAFPVDLPAALQRLKGALAGSDAEKVKAARGAYRELLDRFYEEHRGVIESWQYEGAKADPDYFMALLPWVRYCQAQAVFDRGWSNRYIASTGNFSHEY